MATSVKACFCHNRGTQLLTGERWKRLPSQEPGLEGQPHPHLDLAVLAGSSGGTAPGQPLPCVISHSHTAVTVGVVQIPALPTRKLCDFGPGTGTSLGLHSLICKWSPCHPPHTVTRRIRDKTDRTFGASGYPDSGGRRFDSFYGNP